MADDVDYKLLCKELQVKLETLQSVLCLKCKKIDINDPHNLEHLLQCSNARKSIPHINELDFINREPKKFSNKKRKRTSSMSKLDKDRDTIITIKPIEIKKELNAKPVRSKSSNPQVNTKVEKKVHRVKSDIDYKRHNSASDFLTKISSPFKRKSKLPNKSTKSIASSAPVTTSSGILIPKLDIGTKINTSKPKIENFYIPKDFIPISPKVKAGNNSNLLKVRNFDDDDEMEYIEKDMPDDEDYDADDADDDMNIPTLRMSSDTSAPSSVDNSPHSFNFTNTTNLQYAANQLLALKIRLLEMGIQESQLNELTEVSEILFSGTSGHIPYTRTQSDDRKLLSSTEKIKKRNLFSRKVSKDSTPILYPTLKNTKKEIPEYDFGMETAFTKKVRITKQLFKERPVYQHSICRTRSNTSKEKDDLSVTFPCKNPSVLLKKSFSFNVKYSWENTPSFHNICRDVILCKPSTPKHVSFVLSNIGQKEITSGFILEIFDWLISQTRQSYDEIHTFFLLYRKYTTSSVIFNIILKKWEEASRLNISPTTIIFVLELWIEYYFMCDFAPNRLLSQQLWSFIGQYFKNTEGFRMLTRSWYNKHFVSIKEFQLKPIVPPISPMCKIDLLSDSPLEIARQISLIEFGMFEKIHLFDFLPTDLKKSNAINITINRFNRVSSWVATEIVKLPSAKKRAFVIKQFISIAQACFEMNNFNTLLEITAGLNLVCIRRLKKTWKYVPKRFIELLDELEDIMDNHQNYKRYRSILKNCNLPCLPYIGVIRRDITMIHVGNEDEFNTKWINFEKGKMIWNVLKNDLIRFQQSPYRFHKNIPTINALNNLFIFDEEALFKYSLEWEPSDNQLFDD